MPTITIASDFDGPNADGKAYADRFTGPYEHRILDGIGHNVPQEAPTVFARAVIELARREAELHSTGPNAPRGQGEN